MRSTDTLVLLGTIAAQTGRVAAASSDSLPRGVGPECKNDNDDGLPLLHASHPVPV